MEEQEAPELTPLEIAAIALHEGFYAYVQAGFTRQEALQIVLMQMSLTWRTGGGPG